MKASRYFGRQLVSVRAVKGWDQAELARRIGRKRGWVAHVEQGRRSVSLDQVVEIAAALKVGIAFFIEGALR